MPTYRLALVGESCAVYACLTMRTSCHRQRADDLPWLGKRLFQELRGLNNTFCQLQLPKAAFARHVQVPVIALLVDPTLNANNAGVAFRVLSSEEKRHFTYAWRDATFLGPIIAGQGLTSTLSTISAFHLGVCIWLPCCSS